MKTLTIKNVIIYLIKKIILLNMYMYYKHKISIVFFHQSNIEVQMLIIVYVNNITRTK